MKAAARPATEGRAAARAGGGRRRSTGARPARNPPRPRRAFGGRGGRRGAGWATAARAGDRRQPARPFSSP